MSITSPGFTLTVDGSLSVEELWLNYCTLDGSGNVTVHTNLTTYGSTMTGTGVTTSNWDADFNAGPVFAGSRSFVNLGTADFNNSLTLAASASIVNHHILTLREVNMTYSPTTPIVNNGTLIFDGGIIHFTGTNTIAGAVEFSGGRFFVDGTLTIPTLTHDNGFIDGPGALVVTTAFTWLPGGVQVGTGSTTISATAKFVLPRSTSAARLLAGRTLQVYGTREFPPTMDAGEPVFISVGHVTEDPNHVNEQAFGNGSVNRPPANAPATLPPFDPAAAAGALERAMLGGVAGFGTDEDGVFAQLERMIAPSPAQTVNNQTALFTEYTRLYSGRSLLADIAAELSGDDLLRANALIIARDWNLYVVYTLRAAMYGMSVSIASTDTDRMARLLFDSRTNRPTVESQYNSQFATTASGTVTPADIRADIAAKLWSAQKDRIIAALDGDRAKADAAGLKGLLRGGNGPQIPTAQDIFTLLENRTPAELIAIQTAYGTLTGGSINTLLTDVATFLGNDDYYSGVAAERIDYANALLTGDRIQIAVRGIHLAMSGVGTDEAKIWRLLENTYVDERAMIAQTYFKTYAKTLTQAFCEEFSDSTIWGNELDRTLRIYRNGGLSLAERVFFAVQGWGTDDPMLQAALAEIRTLTPTQVDALDQQYRDSPAARRCATAFSATSAGAIASRPTFRSAAGR